jgi:metal-sulfur cluster biosynthetic enzyme
MDNKTATAPASTTATVEQVTTVDKPLNAAPKVCYDPEEDIEELADGELQDLREEVFDFIRTIKDPEHPYSLEQLRVVSEGAINVQWMREIDPRLSEDDDRVLVTVQFQPTVAHCSLATLIGLCIRYCVLKNFDHLPIKLDLLVTPGSHTTEDEINRQVNDKERVCAALENPIMLEQLKRLTTGAAQGFRD